MREADWTLIRPCLSENERLFGMPPSFEIMPSRDRSVAGD